MTWRDKDITHAVIEKHLNVTCAKRVFLNFTRAVRHSVKGSEAAAHFGVDDEEDIGTPLTGFMP